MKCTLVGIRPVEFTDDHGITHKGQQAFIEYKDKKTIGMAMDKVWLSGDLEIAVVPVMPCKVEVEYFKNRLVDFYVVQ